MLSPEAVAARRGSIGSSDAAAALGLDPHKTPFRLWQEKRGEIEPEDLSQNMAVRLGIKLEPVVAEFFEEETGKRLHHVNRQIIHPTRSYMTCNIDRRVVGEQALAEIKTAGFWAAKSDEWGEEGTDRVPFRYAVQVHHQLACLPAYHLGYVPLLAAGNHSFKVYEIRRDPEIIDMLERVLGVFWQGVLDGIPPAPTNLVQAQERWPESVPAEIEADDDMLEAVAELKAAKGAKQIAMLDEAEWKGRIAVFMGEADTLTSHGKTILTYKTVTRAEHFVKASSGRTMLPK